ncbi:hypothetical protein MUO65_04945 [bacterium]|nr:hypothetical protein [bacterium]
MTIREIENELEKIYKERKSWSGAKGPVTEQSIRLKELILIKQQILYRIEDAKLLRDKREESFNTALYKIIDRNINNLSLKGNKIQPRRN